MGEELAPQTTRVRILAEFLSESLDFEQPLDLSPLDVFYL